MSAPECFNPPSPMNLGLAAVLIVGTIVSYIPQYLSIIKAKSSAGLNFYMLGIALLGAFLTCINSGILKWPDVVCCLDANMNFGMCLENNLATLQLFNSLICYLILYILFLVYFDTVPSETGSRIQKLRSKNFAWWIFILVIIDSIFLAILGGILYYKLNMTSETLTKYAMILGTISSILMIIQWSPQIYTTWKIKSQGTLSLAMLVLQLPGAMLVVIFQGILNQASFTTWGPYIFGAIEMTILIFMIVYYNLKRKNRAQSAMEETDSLLKDFRP